METTLFCSSPRLKGKKGINPHLKEKTSPILIKDTFSKDIKGGYDWSYTCTTRDYTFLPFSLN